MEEAKNVARKPNEGLLRRINLGGSTGTDFPNNYVSTTKYELWNIIPKNLFEQFRRVANIWFLIVSICQMLPFNLSPTTWYATVVPLSGVLFVTFCKDAYEDYQRYRDDKRVNNQICSIMDLSCDDDQPALLRNIKWKDLQVGDYVMVQRDGPIPADMVLLISSNEDGTAFVDTAQLDGETTLKPKIPLEETMKLDMQQLARLEGHVMSEAPNEFVQTFTGALYLTGFPRSVPIEVKNFLLRGSTLRNTQWVFGLVIFSGADTKIRRNSMKTPSKRSRVEVTANRLLFIVFFVLVAAAFSSTVMRAIHIEGEGSVSESWVARKRINSGQQVPRFHNLHYFV
jgi:magnesium-transporting ATPase (P-type)